MAKDEKSGAAQTATSKTELGIRDIIRTMKKNQKAAKTLAAMPAAAKAGTPINLAIKAINEEQDKLVGLAMETVKREIANALKQDE